MDRNNLLRKVATALALKDFDIVRLMGLGGMPISKSAAQDMTRYFNPAKPTKSRRVYEEHLLAFFDGLLADKYNGDLTVEPQESLLVIIKQISRAISAGEDWPTYGSELEARLDDEIFKHRGFRPSKKRKAQ